MIVVDSVSVIDLRLWWLMLSFDFVMLERSITQDLLFTFPARVIEIQYG